MTKWLYEATYKQITSMIDGQFLNQEVRSSELKGVRLGGIDDAQHTMVFFVQSRDYEKNSTVYVSRVRFKDWDDVVDEQDLNPIGRARLLMFSGNLELNCTCPSFLYHGYKYLLTKHGASIQPELRPPVQRNPQQRGIVCKHLNRVIKAFPFYSSDLAKHLKAHHGSKPGAAQSWDLKSKIADYLRNKPNAAVRYSDIA